MEILITLVTAGLVLALLVKSAVFFVSVLALGVKMTALLGIALVVAVFVSSTTPEVSGEVNHEAVALSMVDDAKSLIPAGLTEKLQAQAMAYAASAKAQAEGATNE